MPTVDSMIAPSMYTQAPPGPQAPFPWHAEPGSLMRVSDEGYGPLSGYGQLPGGTGTFMAGGLLAGIGNLVGIGMVVYGIYKRSWGWGLSGVAVNVGTVVLGGGLAMAGAGQAMDASSADFERRKAEMEQEAQRQASRTSLGI